MGGEQVGSVYVSATINTKKYDAGKQHIEDGNAELENNAKKTSSGFSAAWTGAIAGAVAAVVNKGMNMISSSIGTAINRVDTLNNSARTFKNMGIDAKKSKKAMDALSKSIDGLPTPLDSAVRGMTALTATYGDINKGQKIFSALNNAILGFGGTAAQVDNAITQLSQLPMDGPLDAQTWNSLRNSGITPVLAAMAKDSKMSISEMKEAFGKGKLTVQDFTNELLKLNEKGGGGLVSLQQIAQDSTAGIGTSYANLQTAIARSMANIIQAIGPENFSGVIKGVAAQVDAFGKAIVAAIPNIKSGIQIALSKVLDIKNSLANGDFSGAGSKIGKALGEAIVGTLKALSITNKDIGNWFSKINWGNLGVEIGSKAFAFVLGLVTGLFSTDFLSEAFNFIKDNWGKLLIATLTLAFLPSKLLGPIGRIFSTIFSKIPFGSIILKAFGGMTKVIRAAFEPIRTAISDVFRTMFTKPATEAVGILGNILKTVWKIITAPFKLAVDYVAFLIRSIPDGIVAVFKTIGNILSKAGEVIGAIFRGIFTVIKTIFGPLISFFKGIWDGIISSLSGVGQFFGNIFRGAWTVIKTVFEKASGFFKNVWETIKAPFVNVAKWFGDKFAAAFTAIKNLFIKIGTWISEKWAVITKSFGNVGTKIGNAIGGAIKTVINGVIATVQSALNAPIKVINGALGLLRKIPGLGKLGNIPLLNLPRLAKGGEIIAGGLTMVGERGPEILDLPKGSRVIPLNKANNVGGGGVTNHIGVINIDNEVDAAHWLHQLTQESSLAEIGFSRGVQ